MPPLTRTRTTLSIQSRCRRTAKFWRAGAFTDIGGQTRNRIARLDPTTGLADSFDPNASSTVLSIAEQADGKILASGQFSSIGGQTRNRIARLDAGSGTADSFDPNANGIVFSIAVQSDGKILAGGNFLTIGGQPRQFIARLDPTTGAADSFNPNASNTVYSIAVQSDGKVLAGGNFTTIGGQTRTRIARLNADGTLDTAFNPNANSIVYSIAVQADGKVLAGGQFSNIGGQTRFGIARLDPTTGAADSFDPDASSTVYSIAVQADGKVLVGGQFTNIGGQPRNFIARLSNDTAALSTLTVTQTTITLTRDGSAPQFSRVVFEQSTDNGATYTPLGTAANSRPALVEKGKGEEARFAPNAPTAAGYTLTGQNLPTGQNILIRARGFYRTGLQSGSETTEDKVQNVFLLAPTAAGVAVSGRVRTPNGRGLSNAFVTLTDANGNRRSARTTAFGYFHFEDVAAGETYIVEVNSKRYRFTSRVLSINQDISDVELTGEDIFGSSR